MFLKKGFTVFILFLFSLLLTACGSEGKDKTVTIDIGPYSVCGNGIGSIKVGDFLSDIHIKSGVNNCFRITVSPDSPAESYAAKLNTIFGNTDLGLFSRDEFTTENLLKLSTNRSPEDIIHFTSDSYRTFYLVVYGIKESRYELSISSYQNVEPVAEAKMSGSTVVFKQMQLDAGASDDPNGYQLSYHWTIEKSPEGSASQLKSPTQETTFFSPDKPGEYVFSLVVNDGLLDSEPYRLKVNVTNSKPIIVIEPDFEAIIGREIMLDAGKSYDEDGHVLQYLWHLIQKPPGSELVFNDSQSQSISFTPDVAGEYRFQLLADDGAEISQGETTVSAFHTLTPLNFRVTDAKHNRITDKLVMISAETDKLYVFDTADFSITELALPPKPQALSISPDGQFAAVGHDNLISYIDLKNLTLLKILPMNTDVSDVVLDGAGFVHVFPRSGYLEPIHSIDTETGDEKLSAVKISAGATGLLHSDGKSLYVVSYSLEIFDVSSGVAVRQKYIQNAGCLGVSLSKSGHRMVNHCGDIYKVSEQDASDIQYLGTLDNAGGSVAFSEVGQDIVKVTSRRFLSAVNYGNELIFYDDVYFSIKRRLKIPDFIEQGKHYPPIGLLLFFNSTGQRYFSLLSDKHNFNNDAHFSILASVEKDVANAQPVANAGRDQLVKTGNTLYLDGSSSHDENGDALSFKWSILQQPEGSSAVIRGESLNAPELDVDLPGIYQIGLTINDGEIDSHRDEMTVMATDALLPFLYRFDFDVKDAEYSNSLDQLVLASSSSRQLIILQTDDLVQNTIDLPLSPTAISISPDGKFAAVGHKQWVSYIDLVKLELIKTVAVPIDIYDLVLDAKGLAHAFSGTPYSTIAYSVNMQTGEVKPSVGNQVNDKEVVKLSPDGESILGIQFGGLDRFDINAGFINNSERPLLDYSYSLCDRLWVLDGQSKIITGCGRLFNLPVISSLESSYAGKLNMDNTSLLAASYSKNNGEIAGITDSFFDSASEISNSSIHIFDEMTLSETETIALPDFMDKDKTVAMHGRFVFYSSDGSNIYTVVEADKKSRLDRRFGLYVY